MGRSFGVGIFVLCLHSLAALVILLWWVQAPALGGRHWAGLVVMAIAGVCSELHWWRSPVGVLRWDGQQWHWLCGSVSESLEPPVVCLDLQRYMLLQVRIGGGRRLWLHLEQGAFPQRWLDLRRAYIRPLAPRRPPCAARDRAQCILPAHDHSLRSPCRLYR